MGRYVSWVRNELAKAFPDAAYRAGVDLNGNGRIEKNERIDIKTDGAAAWQAFLKKNQTQLRNVGGIFKWCGAFKPDNPIHDLLSIESQLMKPQEIEKAYKTVQKILEIARKEIEGRYLTPEQKLETVYDVMESIGIKFSDQDNNLFTENISRFRLDCDTSSFIALIIAHEMRWPVHLVRAPGHVFVRWDDGKGTRFNYDQGYSLSDEFYIARRRGKISQGSIKRNVYLKNLNRNEVIAIFLNNRAITNVDLGKARDGIKDFDEAIRLDPVHTYHNRGVTKYKLGKYQEAVVDFSTAIELDRNNACLSYRKRGLANRMLGRCKDSTKDFEMAAKLGCETTSTSIYLFFGKHDLFCPPERSFNPLN